GPARVLPKPPCRRGPRHETPAGPGRPAPARPLRASRSLQRLRWKPAEPCRPSFRLWRVAEARERGKNIRRTKISRELLAEPPIAFATSDSPDHDGQPRDKEQANAGLERRGLHRCYGGHLAISSTFS